MLATVRLINAVFYAHHGVMQEEHRIGGRYEVDVALHLDVTQAAERDDLSLTIDYEQVYLTARRVVTENKCFLIERVAWLIATECLALKDAVQRVEVTVRKHNPPVGGTVDRTEVTYVASR